MPGARPLKKGEYVKNPDGSLSTERTITVTNKLLNQGKPTNIPTLWKVGDEIIEADEKKSLNFAKEFGGFKSFNSIDDAVKAAQERSEKGGAFEMSNKMDITKVASNLKGQGYGTKPMEKGGTLKAGSKFKSGAGKEMKTPEWMKSIGEGVEYVGDKVGQAFPKKSWTDVNTQQAVLGALPILAGLAFGGTRGAAIGGQVGLKSLDTIRKGRDDAFDRNVELKKLDLQEKGQTERLAYLQAQLGLRGERQEMQAPLIQAQTGVAQARAQKLKKEAAFVGTAKAGGKIDQFQRKSASFGSRMALSENIIDSVLIRGFDPTESKYRITGKLWREVQEPNWQEYIDAAEDWIAANLRLESGAAIKDDEFDRDFRRYFPLPGDSPQAVASKKLRRRQAEEGMRAGAGKALDDVKQIRKSTEQVPQRDPNIEALAKQSGITYEKAAAIIERRKAQKGGK